MIITQAGLGLRLGELTALRVQDVDFLRRTARVECQRPDGCIFTSAAGRPYRHNYVRTFISWRAARAIGLPTGTTPHDLRHHFASVLLQDGESAVAVAEYLGHEDATEALLRATRASKVLWRNRYEVVDRTATEVTSSG